MRFVFPLAERLFLCHKENPSEGEDHRSVFGQRVGLLGFLQDFLFKFLLLLPVEHFQVRAKPRAPHPLQQMPMRGQQMVIHRLPQLKRTGAAGENFMVLAGGQGIVALKIHFGKIPFGIGGNLTNDAKQRLLLISGHLHRQNPMIREVFHQFGEQGFMMGNPLQTGIGKEQKCYIIKCIKAIFRNYKYRFARFI